MRCYVCDATQDGFCTLVPFKKNRTFEPDQNKPWLEICSDCSVSRTYNDDLGEELRDMAVMDEGFDV